MFAIYGHPEAARLTFYGLYALQHRGQQSAGIVVTDGEHFMEKKAMGLVSEAFQEEDFSRLKGHIACGHVRYATSKNYQFADIQPFSVRYADHSFCLAYTGELLNAEKLRVQLEKEGSIFQTASHAELIMHLLVRHLHLGFEEGLIAALKQVQGAYCMVLMTEDTLVVARDPRGFQPLCLGKLGDSYIVASETCALDLMAGVYLRDVEPGEILFIGKNGLRSLKPFAPARHAHCIFEFVYFARPDSDVFGRNVYLARKRQGATLARENPEVTGEFVMSFPDSGNYPALGFSAQSKIPFEMAMIRNHYVGRTFIQPTQDMRDFGVKVKLNPVRNLVRGKEVIVVDDSIVRGTTISARVQRIRQAGASKIHALIACPPCRYPCYYGVDFSTKGELIASTHSVEEIRRALDLDSLHYLSLEGLLNSVDGSTESGYCTACFSGNYPLLPEEEPEKI